MIQFESLQGIIPMGIGAYLVSYKTILHKHKHFTNILKMKHKKHLKGCNQRSFVPLGSTFLFTTEKL